MVKEVWSNIVKESSKDLEKPCGQKSCVALFGFPNKFIYVIWEAT